MKKGWFARIILTLLVLGMFISVTAAVDTAGCTYTITATNSTGGTIDPSGLVEVATGADQTFVMTPAPSQLNCWGGGIRYVLWNFTVDGVDSGRVESFDPVEYTFTGVDSHHTIHAEFTYGIFDVRPFAKFTANTTSGPVPLTVNFTQVWVTNNTGVLWSFGDNSTSTEQNPIHTYSSTGVYDVTFTIFCNNESFSDPPLEISVMAPPVANFTVSQTFGFRPLDVQFNDTSTGSPPLNYTWNFGDGLTSHERDPLHTYTASGSYYVNLTVSNRAGNSTKTADEPIDVLGPIGGDKGYYLVHSNVDGAKVFLNDAYKGVIENGTLRIQVYTTATPYRTYTVEKDGYQLFHAPITKYPGKDQTVDLYAELIPFEAFYRYLEEGWNLFSTPVTLASQNDTLLSIFTENELQKISVVLGWNGSWYIPLATDEVSPLDAYFIRVNNGRTARAIIVPSDQITPPPSREVNAGVNLIGPAPIYDSGLADFPAMPLNEALISVENVGSLPGYTIVVSPGLNQPGWAYARGGEIKELLPFRGYWIIMENGPDVLAGFSTTPVY